MSRGIYSVLLSLLAIIVVAALLITQQGNSRAFSENIARAANDPLDTTWSTPVVISTSTGYGGGEFMAASPLNGAVQVVWAPWDGSQGGIGTTSNRSLGGPFGPEQNINDGTDGLISFAHDNLGRRHLTSWIWPQGSPLCDYYKQFDTDGNLILSETIPGSCDPTAPRKMGAVAVDSNLIVHILLGRNGQAGSLRYWERNNKGVWIVQNEAVPTSCSVGDLALTVSTTGTVMAAIKDCAASGQGSDIYTAVRTPPGNWQLDNISSECCTGCPDTSGAYLPQLAPDPSGGIRAAWVDGRCTAGGPTDIYYREWVPGSGWTSQPIVQVVNNIGLSYWPSIAVDAAGEAHIAWADDYQSPISYYRIFYSHGHGSVFSAPEVPFDSSSPPSWSRDPHLDFAFNAVHIIFISARDGPDPKPYYSYTNTSAPTPTATPTLAPPPCPSAQFKDVCPGTTFYTNVVNLADAGIISGYNSAPPCPNSLWIPCFLPNNSATRGQVSKIIVLGADLPINTAGGPHFTDVPTTSAFYQYIETMYNAGIIGGYTTSCPSGPPCFRPTNNVTRGQLSKMASIAFNFNEAVSGQTFEDVPTSSTFYAYIERLSGRGVINGYACGGAGEPCVPPENRPYFRPNSNVTRGQITRIVDFCRQQAPGAR